MSHDLFAGKKLTIHGRRYTINKELGPGGFGTAWLVDPKGEPEPLVLKVFHDHDPELIERLRAIRELQLERDLLCFTGIRHVIEPNGSRDWSGTICEYVPGEDLTAWVKRREFNMMHALMVVFQIVAPLAGLHKRGYTHGDVHPSNFRVAEEDGVPKIQAIDIDNLGGPGLPAAPAMGQLNFMAPEIYEAYYQRTRRVPDIPAELASTAKLLHLVLFQRMAFASLINQPEEYARASIRGGWDQDPCRGEVDIAALGGIPNVVINDRLAELMRRGLDRNRDNRPSMEEWAAALRDAVDQVYLCPRHDCGGPNLLDASKTNCPFCRRPYPVLGVVAGGQRIIINCPAIPVGREHLGSPRVSGRHAVLRRFGPETYVRNYGRNGTFKRVRGEWIRVGDDVWCPIRSGDQLCFADVQAEVVEA